VRDGDDSVDATAAYRDDLARVMRPTRVRVDVTRRRDVRTAPLVLVSEQRIDRDDDLSGEEVRPRRVNAVSEEFAEGETMHAQAAEGGARFAQMPAAARPLEPPKKISRSLAELARRAGDMMRTREAATPDDAEDTHQAQTEQPVQPPVFDAKTSDDAAPGPQNELPDFVLRFAALLEESDATEIDEVVEMGAAFITDDLGQTEFKRVQLIRLVRMATDDSIGRDAAFSSMMRLSDRGVLTQSANGRYRLNAPGKD
jgi:hypothetical protein